MKFVHIKDVTKRMYGTERTIVNKFLWLPVTIVTREDIGAAAIPDTPMAVRYTGTRQVSETRWLSFETYTVKWTKGVGCDDFWRKVRWGI